MTFAVHPPIGGPGRGLFETTMDVRVTNRTGGAINRGEVVMFDMALTATETTTAEPGSESSDLGVSAFNSVIRSLTTFNEGFFFALVVDETIADNAAGTVRVQGIFDKALVSDDVVLGARLVASGGASTMTTGGNFVAGSRKIIALALQTKTSGVAKVLFDGIYGFGQSRTALP